MAGAKRDTWYQRDPAQARRGMRGLTLEEKAIYQEIIDITYEFGAPPVDDPQRIAHLCECHTKVFIRVRAELVRKGRIVIVDGKLVDVRAKETIEARAAARAEAVEKASRAGKKSAAKRAAARDEPGGNREGTRFGNDLHRGVSNEIIDEFQPEVESELEVQLLDLDSDSFLGLDCNVDGALPPLRADSPLLAFDGPTKPDDELTDIELNRLCVGAFGRRPVESETMMLATIGHIRDAMRAGCDLRRHILPFIALRTRDGRLGVVRYWSYFPMTALLDRRNAERAHVGDEILDAHARAALRLARGKKGKVA